MTKYTFNISNEFNNCPEFVNYISADITLTEKSHYITILLNSLTVNDNRIKNFFVRHKIYITSIPLDNNEMSLENIISKANKHAAKVTQEMHELNFASIRPINASPYHDGYKTASSFDELLKFGEDQSTRNSNYCSWETYSTYEEAQQAIVATTTRYLKKPYITISESHTVLQNFDTLS